MIVNIVVTFWEKVIIGERVFGGLVMFYFLTWVMISWVYL